MTQSYFPFDSGAGASVAEAQWQKMAENWLNTGVIKGLLNELLVYADSTGMRVKVKSGRAWIKGHFYDSDVEEILTISAASALNPRIDRVVLRLDWTANTIQLAVLQGTVAASPVAPSLTQNTSRWEISLAQVRVEKSIATIAVDKVTDERFFVGNANITNEKWTDLVLQNAWVYFGTPYATAQFKKSTNGIVMVKGFIKLGTATANTVIAQLPAGYRPKENRYFPCFDGANVAQRFLVDPSGNITNASGTTINNAWLILDSIVFEAEQ